MKTNLNLLLASAACAALAACAGSGSAPDVSADTIFTNAKIVTVDASSTVARAVAIKDGKFLRVGSPADVLRHRGPNTKVFDLSGQTIIPGLTDSHFHNAGGGPGVDLSKARSLADLTAAVRAAAGRAAAGTVVISNSDWHEAQLAEQRLPTAEEIEAAAPGVPVVLVRGGHSYFLNTTALARYGITTSTVVPAGGVIARNAQGRLTGEVTSNAKTLVTLPPPPAVTTADLDAQQRVINSYGVTAVTMPGITTATYAQLKELRDTGKATVRYNVMFRTANPAAVTALGTSGIKPGEGDEWVKVWGIKLIVDGGFEGGHMTRAYLDPLGAGGKYFGVRVTTQSAYDEVVNAVNQQGWRATTHVVGDAGMDQVLAGYEKANAAKNLTRAGWAVEHAFVTRPDQYPRMKALNLRLSVQDHLYLAAPTLRGYWGLDRASQVTPLKAYMDQGFLIALGTDAAVIPMNPFWMMYHFLTRDTISAGVFGANQAVTSREAVLRMITLNHYKLTDQESLSGSIEAGKFADFVILSADYMTIPDKQVQNLKALATFVGGKMVYKDPAYSL